MINQTPLTSCEIKFPFDLLYSTKPMMLQNIWFIYYVHVHDATRTKFDAKARIVSSLDLILERKV